MVTKKAFFHIKMELACFSFINYYENIPCGWEEIKLNNIVTITGGKRIPVGSKFSDCETPYKYLRVTDMKQNSIIGCAYIHQEIYESIKNYIITDADIYITVAGTIGNAGCVPKKYSYANLTENADKIVIYNQTIFKKWLVHCLNSPIIQYQIFRLITKVGQPKLSIQSISKLNIKLPPIKEQIRIIEQLEKITHSSKNFINFIIYS